MERIISSFSAFESKFKDSEFLKKEDSRKNALKRYFSKGGVVSVSQKKGSWPSLLYPSKSRVRQQVEEVSRLKKLFESKHSDWTKKFNEAKTHNLKNHAKKFIDPLYWKHLVKSLSDNEYKEDLKAVGMPSEIVSEKRYRPMFDMFLNNLDYRKQLVETVQNSVVYKKDRRVAVYASMLQGFRKGISSSQLNELKKKLSEINSDLEMLKEIEKWANE